MLVTVDKRGSITLPTALRKELGLDAGAHLDLTVDAGGGILLRPVSVYPSVRLSERGLGKLQEARRSGSATLPDWVRDEMRDVGTDSE